VIQQQQKKSPSSTPTSKSDSPTAAKKESSKESSSSSKSSSNNGSGTARRNKSNPTSTSKDQSTQSKDVKGSGLQITTAVFDSHFFSLFYSYSFREIQEMTIAPIKLKIVPKLVIM
jgi:hypothetical protein